MMMIDEINIDVSPVFYANLLAFNDTNYNIIVNQGGTRSGKTFSILQLLCIAAYYSTEPLEISTVSHTLPHIKKGSLRDFYKIMQSMGIFEEKKFNKTEMIYKFSPNVFMEFFSADNGDKLRGPSRDILFVNEVNLITFDEWKQLIMRTRGKTFCDYNPADEFHWIYDSVLPRKDVKFIQSTYLDNYDFLPQSQIDEIERLKIEDPTYWKIYGLGEKAQATNLIYTKFRVVNSCPSGDTIYGLDFGYNNPTALIEITNADNEIYLRERIYETKLTNSDLIEKFKTMNLGNAFIYADSAEPQRIDEIYRAGFNIHPADKAVKPGIDYCKRYSLNILSDSPYILKEIKGYKYKEDKNGNIIDDSPLKFNDHAMDAFRYALYTHGVKYWTTQKMFFPKNIQNTRLSIKDSLNKM